MKNSITIFIIFIVVFFISCSKKDIQKQGNITTKKDSVTNTNKQTEDKSDTLKVSKKLNIDNILKCTVKKNKKTYKSKDGKAIFKIEIPEISGLENKEVQANINETLKKVFTSNIEAFGDSMSIDNEKDMEKFAKDLKEINGTYDCDITSDVTMNKNGILSIRLYYLGFQVPAAHPTKDFKGININLSTGEKIVLANLFKEKTDYIKIIEKFLKKDGQEIPDKENLKFDFCITSKSFIIFNLLYGAAASYDLEINFKDIKDDLIEDIAGWN